MRRAQARLRLSRLAEADAGATGVSPASHSLAGSGLDRALNSIDAAFAEYGSDKRRGARRGALPDAGRATGAAVPRRPSRRGGARHSADIVPDAARSASPTPLSPPTLPPKVAPAAIAAEQGAPPVRRVRVVKRPNATTVRMAAAAPPQPPQAVRRVAAVAAKSPKTTTAPSEAPAREGPASGPELGAVGPARPLPRTARALRAGVGHLQDAVDDLREAVKAELRLTMKAFAGGVRALLGSAARAETEAESAAEALRRANLRADAADKRASQLEAELLSAQARAKEAQLEAARMATERDEAATATRKRELHPPGMPTVLPSHRAVICLRSAMLPLPLLLVNRAGNRLAPTPHPNPAQVGMHCMRHGAP